MNYTKKQIGDVGEDYCAKYLKRRGCKIIRRNYCKPCGEIDIIAEHRGVLCFVEVKTRHYGSLAQPYEAVDFRKQKRIIRAAQLYLAETGWDGYCRFDVCEVITSQNNLALLRIHYIENAFELRS